MTKALHQPEEGASALPVRVPLATRPLGILGTLRVGRRNVLELVPEIATRQPIVSGRSPRRWHMVMDPGALRRILIERLDDYPKSEVTKNVLRPAIGESLFVAEGAHWRWQRRTAAPVFSQRNIRSLTPIMTAAAARAAERLDAQAGRAADLFAEMLRTTFEVISDVTFSGGEGLDRQAVHAAIDAYMAQTARVSLLDVLGAPAWVPRPNRILSGRALDRMKRIADRAIDSRRATGPGAVPDLLDLLLAGHDPESGRQMTTGELRDNLLAFIVAGHETTSLALAWSLYLLAFDPGWQARLRDEVRAAIGDRPATAEDLSAMPLVRQVIEEALRLYPPAAFLSRTARRADTLLGREIRPGDTVILPIYALHRNRLLWEEPDAFRPERFRDGRPVDRFAYLPFGDGPRICIGAQFAIQEASVILATLLGRLRFRAIPGRDPRPTLILTLRPEGGVWLEIERV
ncbi:MAG: cytochrome P450 [Alphaproteobacteria bacterium]|nr:MAG: cytochrome P450 [Alphaproteobacteria bacterium]